MGERDRIYPPTRYTSFACTYRKDRISDMRRDNLCMDFMRHVNDVFAGSIKVKCGQTGKVFVTKVHNLSKEDQAESLTIEDLKVIGAGLLCDVKGKMYPVEVLEFKGQYI